LNVNEEIDKLLNDFTEKWANDLEDSLAKALKDGGRTNPQQSRIQFKGGVKYYPNKVVILITPSDDYWYYIDKGRNGKKKKWNKDGTSNPKAPRTDDLEKWVKVNLTFSLSKKRQSIAKKIKNKTVKKAYKQITVAKAVKQVAYVVARKIGEFGVKPRPFVDRVIDDGRKEALAEQLGKLIGKEIIVT
jgi:hypothetical protein